MIDSLVSLCGLVGLVLSAFGIGALVLRRVRSWGNIAEQVVFAISIGMGVLGYAVFALGLSGLLRRPALWVMLFAPVLLVIMLTPLVTGKIGLHSLLRIAPPEGEEKGKRTLLSWLCGIVLAGLGLFTLIGALAPPGGNEWDALSYHLAVPKIYLREGRIFYIPWVSHSNFPFVLQMLYTLMLGLGSVGAAKLCHWLCGVLLVLSVYTFAARHFTPAPRGRRIGLIAALIVAATPIVLWEASVAYVDLATALFTWLSLYALFNAAQAVEIAPSPPPARPHPRPLSRSGRGEPATAAAPASHESKEDLAGREAGVGNATGTPLPSAGEGTGVGASTAWLVVSAVLMGLALGTKYTVLGFWGMLLVGIFVWYFVTTGRWAKVTLPHTALWGAVSLLVAAPWYIKTWLYTGNPVYPFFYNVFGGRYWNTPNAEQYTAAQSRFGFGKGAVDLLLSPWQATMPLTARKFTEYGFALSPVYVALLLAAPLLVKRLSRTSVTLTFFALGGYAFWFILMQQTRYLIPVLPALAIVCAEVLADAWDTTRFARWTGAALVAVSAVWGLYLSGVNIAAPALPVVTGRVTTREYVTGTMRMVGAGGVMPAIAFINRETPRDAKVALFGEERGFYLDREYLWATPNHSTLLPWDRYADVDDWLRDFKQRGFTTLLINTGSPLPEDQRWPTLIQEALAANKVSLVFVEDKVQVYRIP